MHLFTFAQDVLAGALAKYESLWQNYFNDDDSVLFIFPIIILKEFGHHKNAIMTDKLHYLRA